MPVQLEIFERAWEPTWAQSFAPAGWSDDIKLNEPADLNPDPRVVEVDLTARLAEVEVAPGKRVHAWTYNGGIPGPLIKTHVGDRVIVHFKNELKDPTTVHWHGVRLPIEMDGVPGVSQDEVKQGESFTYDFVVRDAGFFFQVVDDQGEPVGPVAWKDTVNVPMKTTARFLVKFDERPGEWMFHCHILDHADGGLMGTVLVGPVAPSPHVHTKTQ